MRPAVTAAVLLGWIGAASLAAQEPSVPPPPAAPVCPTVCALAESLPVVVVQPPAGETTVPAEALPWHTVWGVAGLRVIPDGAKIAPNGGEYHPNFSIDVDLNLWLWRSQGLYLFGDARLWGQKSEDGVTNGKDGFWGTSKREFDAWGGAAWNYAGSWEARAFGYSLSNLNRGNSAVTPSGFNDGSGLENRYYLSPEYADLGRPGFDVARADFLSVGYYPTKEMVGNDGQLFKPGLFLRAYLTCDLGELPCYAFADATFITEQSLRAKLFLFDLGLAARPFPRLPQFEFRAGAENTGDFDTRGVLNLWYLSVRYIF